MQQLTSGRRVVEEKEEDEGEATVEEEVAGFEGDIAA